MQFKYGGYSFDDNRVILQSFRVRPKRSLRGRRMGYVISMQCSGEIVPADSDTTKAQMQATINNKVAQVENAFADDFKDAGFYLDDGSVSNHFISTNASNNLSGVQVDYFNWRPSPHEEFVSLRSFEFGFWAEFRDTYSSLIDFTDQIIRIGTGGPIYSWRLHPVALSYPRQLTNYSMQKFVHRGSATTLNAYYSPPPPIAFGNQYLEHLTKIIKTTPRCHARPGKYSLYRTSWEYVYVSPTPVNLSPYLV